MQVNDLVYHIHIPKLVDISSHAAIPAVIVQGAPSVPLNAPYRRCIQLHSKLRCYDDVSLSFYLLRIKNRVLPRQILKTTAGSRMLILLLDHLDTVDTNSLMRCLACLCATNYHTDTIIEAIRRLRCRLPDFTLNTVMTAGLYSCPISQIRSVLIECGAHIDRESVATLAHFDCLAVGNGLLDYMQSRVPYLSRDDILSEWYTPRNLAWTGDVQDMDRVSLLECAVWSHDLNMIQLLMQRLSQLGELRSERPHEGRLAACWHIGQIALRCGDAALWRLLIDDYGINVITCNAMSNNVWRAYPCDVSLAQFLVEHGADTKDAIVSVSRDNSLAVLRYLVEIVGLGIAPDVLAKASETFGPDELSRWFPDIGVLDYLILRGADVNARDSRGNTMAMNCPSYARYLIDNCTDITIKNEHGQNIVHRMAMRRPHDIHDDRESQLLVQVAVGLRVDVMTADDDGRTALHIACQSGNIHMISALLHTSPDIVNVSDRQGNTALFYAYDGYLSDIVNILVSSGANFGNGGSIARWLQTARACIIDRTFGQR